MAAGRSAGDAWNSLQSDLIASTRPHVLFFVAQRLINKVESSQNLRDIYPVLKKLSDLFALHSIQQLGEAFLEHGYMTPADLKAVRQTVRDCNNT